MPLGLDLAAEWRSRRWRRLLNVVEGLPRNSHLAEAIAQDEEAARAYLNALRDADGDEVDPGPPAGPRWREWSPERDALARVEDLLAQAVAAIVASAGGKPGRPQPSPRPTSAADALQEMDRRVEHVVLMTRLFPQRAPEGAPREP